MRQMRHKKILYSIGDSVVWGAELENIEKERFSNSLSKKLGAVDCNNATAGVSNDYIFRHAIRDINHFLRKGEVWSEETGWVKGDEFVLCMGITSPTRFEWWDGDKYQQERLWKGYDKWGKNDEKRTTEDKFVLHQTELIPSYIRTLQGIIAIQNICENEKIPYIIFNTFFKWNIHEIKEPKHRIDKWGKIRDQLSLKSYWDMIPLNFKMESMYECFKRRGGGVLERNHPTKESHKIWSDFLYKLYKEHENEDEF